MIKRIDILRQTKLSGAVAMRKLLDNVSTIKIKRTTKARIIIIAREHQRLQLDVELYEYGC